MRPKQKGKNEFVYTSHKDAYRGTKKSAHSYSGHKSSQGVKKREEERKGVQEGEEENLQRHTTLFGLGEMGMFSHQFSDKISVE